MQKPAVVLYEAAVDDSWIMPSWLSWLLPMSSHRKILRATAIVGGASAINIIVGLARNKAAALLLGPAGVGLAGLLLSLVTTISSITSLGAGSAAVRQIAHDNDPTVQSAVRLSLRRLMLLLSPMGAFATWLLRRPLAALLLGDPRLAWQVGWLAPAVALTIWSSGQIALLNGLRRLRDLAGTQVFGALLGTMLGMTALALWGTGGILLYVLAAPLAMVAAGAWFVLRAPPKATDVRPSWPVILSMLQLGIPLMLGGISVSVGALAIRSVIGTHIGAVQLGAFTAAWTLSVTYVGFVLQAMGTDYLPRLTAVIGNHEDACRSVNEQAEVALLIALPVILGMQAAAPWVVWLLYSSAFTGATDVLRWLVVADVMKIVSWPLGFVIIAQARAKTLLLLEATTLALTLSMVALLIGRFGLAAAGIGYCGSYLFYLACVGLLARRSIGFRPSRGVVALTAAGVPAVTACAIVGTLMPVAGLIGGGALALGAIAYAIMRLNQLDALPTALKRFASPLQTG